MNVILSGLFGESFLYILGLFLEVKVQNWKMCLGLLNFKYFWGMPYIPYIFDYFFGGMGGGGRVKSRCWAQAYLFRKMKESPMGSGTLAT